MTTTTLTARQRVGAVTGAIIAPLQWGYLNDRPEAVAALARLRRGAGKQFSEMPDLWGLADTRPLHAPPADGGRVLREDELIRAEDAVHVALTLWALHQQSQSQGMHQAHRPTAPRGLGAAVRRLMPPNEIAEPLRKRLVRAGNAADLPAVAQRLRDLVVLLRAGDVQLDYALLAEQLYHWQEPGGRDAVRREWGRSFQAVRASDDTSGKAPGSSAPAGTTSPSSGDSTVANPGDNTGFTDSIDKDAS
ncbi:type I-E CRISPR-associated protein Cse2/CasB [Streptomyces sp. NPDC088261]|uniref:type I-E CRISPR-associated protein Cse2/CasB n=1 Tax=Streptomyces sp. NPDC088261 TaxID=3365851 RepID=UPI0038163CF1